MQLGSHIAVAVAVASSCSSDSTPSLGTSMCHGCRNKKKKKEKEKERASGVEKTTQHGEGIGSVLELSETRFLGKLQEQVKKQNKTKQNLPCKEA